MTETIELGELSITFTRKAIKHVHLSVHPPDGRVTLTAPLTTRLDVARAYAISKLDWIRRRQGQMRAQARETPRAFVERESHYLWGRRYLLRVVERETKPSVVIDHKHLTLSVRPGSDQTKRAEILQGWYRAQLHAVAPPLIRIWEPKLGVKVEAYFLQRMKTQWGSCNHRAGHIRLNTELAKKPRDLLEYVVVHEMLHLIEPTHNQRFLALLSEHYPNWREARAELNEWPLAADIEARRLD